MTQQRCFPFHWTCNPYNTLVLNIIGNKSSHRNYSVCRGTRGYHIPFKSMLIEAFYHLVSVAQVHLRSAEKKMEVGTHSGIVGWHRTNTQVPGNLQGPSTLAHIPEPKAEWTQANVPAGRTSACLNSPSLIVWPLPSVSTMHTY